MTLTSGTHFGHYEISGPLGKGGMGEVYRARDIELGRDVAIKVLPASFAADADRVARFEQEARTLATLNHPNIAHIYGIERSSAEPAGASAPSSDTGAATAADDSAESPGETLALVMELVEGPTLADRIAEGPIPADEALGIAMQLTDALEAAHEKLIVHRDLKPANIKLRSDGTVKVLDFGIAKAFEPAALVSGSDSPILTTPATQAGVILGTAAYMSPEQAKGKTVDKRTDIWAFGCVLYEMLTGQLAFGGEDVATTLARVIANEADVGLLPAAISPAVRRVLELCLQKDPRNRIRDIGDVKLALGGEFDAGKGTNLENAATPAAVGWRRAIPLTVGLLAGGLIVGMTLRALQPPPPMRVPASHYALLPPADAILPIAAASGPQAAMSPDGRYLAFALEDPETGMVAPVPQSEGYVLLHSWTPDGRYLVVQQGPTVSLIQAPPLSGPAASTTAAPAEVFSANYATDHFRVSPDGNWVAYTSQESGQPEIMIAAFPGFTDRRQISVSGGTQPQWRADGRELFFHANDQHIMAVDVTPGEALDIGTVQRLFETNETVHSPIIFMYAATSDGQRFLLTEPVESSSPGSEPLYVMRNWQTLLEK